MPTYTTREEAALRALGDPIRLRIVEALASEELCVCHLTQMFGVGQSLLSHHMHALVTAGLVRGERRSYWTYYRLRPEALSRLTAVLARLQKQAAARHPRRPCPPSESAAATPARIARTRIRGTVPRT